MDIWERPHSGPSPVEDPTRGSRLRSSAKIYLGLRAVPHAVGSLAVMADPKSSMLGHGLHVAFRARAPLDYTGDLPWASWPVVSSSSLPRVSEYAPIHTRPDLSYLW